LQDEDDDDQTGDEASKSRLPDGTMYDTTQYEDDENGNKTNKKRGEFATGVGGWQNMNLLGMAIASQDLRNDKPNSISQDFALQCN